MKTYRIGIIDWESKKKNNLTFKVAHGIKEARAKVDGVKLHYDKNTNCHVGYSSDGRYEYVVYEM